MDNAERLNLGGIVTDPNAPGRVVIELDFGITVYPPQPVPEETRRSGRRGGGRCGTRKASGSSASR